MIENNNRREGPIVRFSDDSFWLEKAAYKLHPSEWGDYYFSAHIDEIESNNQNQNKNSKVLFQEATNLLNAFRRGDLTTSEVFDVDKLAKSMAIGDLLGGWHGFLVFNTKFYYNPITCRLEPIPDDSFTEFISLDSGLLRLNDKYATGAFLQQVFSDLLFTERYLFELNRITSTSYVKNTLLKLKSDINLNLDRIKIDYPWYNFPEDEIYQNREALQEILNPNRGILAYYSNYVSHSVQVKIAATKSLPVELILAKYDNEFDLYPLKKYIIKGRDYLNQLEYFTYTFMSSNDMGAIINPDKLQIIYRILGTNIIKTETVRNYEAYDINNLYVNPKLLKPNYKNCKFLDIDSLSETINIKTGDWVLSNNLIIPSGYILICSPATSIDLLNSSTIISYSPIEFSGESGAPIKIMSSDSSGGGIAVYANGKVSKVDNVIFSNLYLSSDNAWKRSGAVTFYESPVSIQNSQFINLESEDGINIINSRFNLENTLFVGSYSDAIDVDFGQGSINNSRFISPGNDAIDVSGSYVTISNSYIDGANDKGISIGENSNVQMENINITNCRIAIAVKDDSYSKIKNTAIEKCIYGITAYQKKPEFGPSQITADLIHMRDVEYKYYVESGSSLLVDNSSIPEKQVNVYRQLYDK